MMLAVVSSWLGYLAWNLCSRRLPVSLTGQMVVLKPFSRCYMVLSIHSAFRISESAAITLLIGGVMFTLHYHQHNHGGDVSNTSEVNRS